MRIDLNADVGERVGGATAESDGALMATITSANVACGYHAGSRTIMKAMVEMAKAHGVAVGAHPSFADREGFGRREIHLPLAEIGALVRRQLELIADIVGSQDVPLSHVKPHGALYNMAAKDRKLADAIAAAVAAFDRTLTLVGLAGSALIDAGRDAGLAVAREGFADRAYRQDGSLVPRSEPGAVLGVGGGSEEVRSTLQSADRAVALAQTGAVDTICVHGDTPGAVEIARSIRAALAAAGITVQAVGR
jgi:UPF0271 protein